MDFKKANIYYFSGTGNTLIAAKSVQKVFEANNVPTRLFAMEKEPSTNVDTSCLVGLAFPIAVFTSYPLVMNFIQKMPNANGTPVFMIATMGGMSAGIRSYLKNLLTKKGYKPIGAKQFVMPDNYMASLEKDKKNPRIVDKSVNQAELFAKQLLEGKASWGSFPVLPVIAHAISQTLFKTSSFKKAVKINKAKCVQCGLCSRLCPVGNIVMREHPTFLNKCEVCMRCISYCPSGALYRRHDGEHVYAGVDVQEFLRQ